MDVTEGKAAYFFYTNCLGVEAVNAVVFSGRSVAFITESGSPRRSALAAEASALHLQVFLLVHQQEAPDAVGSLLRLPRTDAHALHLLHQHFGHRCGTAQHTSATGKAKRKFTMTPARLSITTTARGGRAGPRGARRP